MCAQRADALESIAIRAFLLQQIKRAAQTSHEWHAAGGHLKATAVVMEGVWIISHSPRFILKAAPTDHGGMAVREHTL